MSDAPVSRGWYCPMHQLTAVNWATMEGEGMKLTLSQSLIKFLKTRMCTVPHPAQEVMRLAIGVDTSQYLDCE